MTDQARLKNLELRLLLGRTQRYLRYLHARDALARVADEVETVCVCGTGHAFAEIALAIEFPHIEFYLTDIIAQGYPNYHHAADLVWKWQIPNVQFHVWNVLQPTPRRFDMIMSTEMLEHIEQDTKAAANMRATATKYVYCLVPYASKRQNANDRLRKKVWENNQHYLVGYDPEMIERMFPEPVMMSGTYWHDICQPLREDLKVMSNDEITASRQTLLERAHMDLRHEMPEENCSGIKVLSRTG